MTDPIFEQVEGSPASKVDPEIVHHLKETTDSPIIREGLRLLMKAKGNIPSTAKSWGESIIKTAPEFEQTPGIKMNIRMANALIKGELNNEVEAILGTG